MRYSVSTVKTSKGEVIFYLIKWREKILSGRLDNRRQKSNIYQREFGNLHQIKNHFPKYVISMDDFIHHTDEGVRHIHLLEFFKGVA